MMVREYSRAKEFLSRVKDFLREREDVNGLPLGILLGLAAASSPQKGFFATAEEQGDLSLVMVMTTGHLILASAGPDWQRGVAGLSVPGRRPSFLPSCGGPGCPYRLKWNSEFTAWKP